MKNLHTLIVCCVLIISVEAGRAQKGKPLRLPSNQQVLIDDTHAESLKLAKENREHQQASALSVLSNLSEKQKRSILRIEADRDKTLVQIDEKIKAKKESLKALKSSVPEDKKMLDKTACEISKLAIKEQKVKASAKKKIRSQLTKDQQTIFDNI